ncbi:MAG: nitroreductase family deazaflavin-dependent oxidoreductase [Acidimicrobiales bacterium]
MSRYDDVVNRFSATTVGSWLVKHVASRLDPLIFKATKGRFTSTGRPTLPMLALTVPGRHSGEPRTVQLAYVADGDDYLVVASAMGQERHPAWRYNLEAAETATIQLRGQVQTVEATVLADDDKAEYWPRIEEAIPQMRTYLTRTDRNIRVFRLSPM